MHFKANTSLLRERASDINVELDCIKELYDYFFTRVGNIAQGTGEWKGAVAENYATLALKDKNQYIKFNNELYEYTKLLNYIADEIDRSVRKLGE